MIERPEGLPDFEKPPVVEVALLVQFEPLPGLTTPELAEFWLRIRDRFPKWEEAQPIRLVREVFGLPTAGELQSTRFRVASGPRWVPSRAIFAESGAAHEIVQLQPDCLGHNWRKIGTDPYPRYERIRARFAEDLAAFRKFVAERQLGELSITQAEVTYVNHISLPNAGGFADIERFCRPWCGDASDSFLPRPETIEISTHYQITEKGLPEGRLHVEVRPEYRLADASPLLNVVLTARGRPRGQADEDVLEWMDLGRQWVVRGFASFTTEEAHKSWGRRDGG